MVMVRVNEEGGMGQFSIPTPVLPDTESIAAAFKTIPWDGCKVAAIVQSFDERVMGREAAQKVSAEGRAAVLRKTGRVVNGYEEEAIWSCPPQRTAPPTTTTPPVTTAPPTTTTTPPTTTTPSTTTPPSKTTQQQSAGEPFPTVPVAIAAAALVLGLAIITLVK
jgi:hypothetical protein